MMNPSPHRYLAGKTIVLLSATLFLTGCSTIGTRIEESIQSAQALHDRCEQVDDAIGSETGSVTYGSIAERVKLRLEEACTDPSQPKASGVGADQCVMDWEQRVRSIWTQVTPTAGDQNNFQAAAAVVETAAGAIRDDKLKIANDLNILIGSWTTNAKKDREFCKQSRQACADQIIGFLTSSTNVAAFGVLRADITKLQTDGQTFDSALSALAGPTAAATSNASTSIQAALQQLRGLQAELDGSISDATQAFQALDDKDNAAAVKTMLASRFYPEAAEKSLRLIQRGLTPVDRLIDKIDDKTYLVSGIVMEVYQNKIQDAFDEIYARYVRKTIPFQGQVALAKAACTELEAAPISSDPPPSTTMDFFLEMFTNIDANSTELIKCQSRVAPYTGTDPSTCDATVQAELETKGTPAVAGARARMVLASVIKEANASSAARLATGVSSAEVQTATLEHINSGNTLLPNSVDNLSFMDKLAIASSSAKHDKSDMSDDTKFKDYISAQANARQALAKAGLPVDPEKVESIAASATGDAVLAYQQRCGGTSCSDPEVQDQTLKSQSVQVTQYVNLRVSQVLIANQSVTVNVAPPTPALAPSLGPDICALISAEHTRGLSCIKRGANLVRVHIQATFPAGRADDIRVRDSLRTLGEIMRSTGHTFDARFSASASRSRADCGVKDQAQANFTHPGGSTKVLCGADNLNDPLSAGELTQPSVERSGNFVLSLNRAIWSETTLSEAAGQSLASASLEALSSQTAWPTDSPDDRRVYVDLTTTH